MSNCPIPEFAQKSTFWHKNVRYEIAVWKSVHLAGTWVWAAAGNTSISGSSEDAIRSAREWIKNGVHGAQRARL